MLVRCTLCSHKHHRPSVMFGHVLSHLIWSNNSGCDDQWPNVFMMSNAFICTICQSKIKDNFKQCFSFSFSSVTDLEATTVYYKYRYRISIDLDTFFPLSKTADNTIWLYSVCLNGILTKYSPSLYMDLKQIIHQNYWKQTIH